MKSSYKGKYYLIFISWFPKLGFSEILILILFLPVWGFGFVMTESRDFSKLGHMKPQTVTHFLIV